MDVSQQRTVIRRKDRRGRGPRGPLMPAALPAARTRAQIFDDHMVNSLQHIPPYWREKLDGTEFAVELVPPSRPAVWESQHVRLGRSFPGDIGLAPRIVLYRRPIETRAQNNSELQAIIHDVLLEYVAISLDVSVQDIDPDYGVQG